MSGEGCSGGNPHRRCSVLRRCPDPGRGAGRGPDGAGAAGRRAGADRGRVPRHPHGIGYDVSEDRAATVAAGKTGALLACACELGAIAGGATEERAQLLHGFGQRLGIAYQCVDDVLGIWGEEPVTGKPALSDLRSRKVTMPVAAAMAGNTPQAQSLRALYSGNGPLGEEDYTRARDWIEQSGAREATLRRARRHTADALHLVDQAQLEPSAAAELAALADLITHRDH
ncbi:polyprenyl synthetase family protein [Streptomyces bottropensis]|uniref:polyprenyl synthetase family protein n=1 Tax=Streptomyces bottropensis TaxID=42235 RepID=UPI0036B38A6E